MIRHGFNNNSLRKMLSFHKKNSSWTKKETRKVASKRKSTFHSRTTDFSQYPIIYFSQQNSPLLPSSFPFALPIYSPLIITNQSSSPNNKKEQLPYPYLSEGPTIRPSVTIQRKCRPATTLVVIRNEIPPSTLQRERCYLAEIPKRDVEDVSALSLSDNTGHSRCTPLTIQFHISPERVAPPQGNTLLVNAVWIQHAWIGRCCYWAVIPHRGS